MTVISLQSLFAPPRCEACGQGGAFGLCVACESGWKILDSRSCVQCALPFESEGTSPHRCVACLADPPSFDKIVSAFAFEGPIPHLVHGMKFSGNRNGLKILAGRARDAFQDCVAAISPDFLCPMPLSFFRRLRRGFNQSHLLAWELQKNSRRPLPFLEGMRRRWRMAQATKGRADRLRALRGTMSYRGRNSLKGMRVLGVDDVVTTGATAEAFARSLKQAGADYVAVFSLARVKRQLKETK